MRLSPRIQDLTLPGLCPFMFQLAHPMWDAHTQIVTGLEQLVMVTRSGFLLWSCVICSARAVARSAAGVLVSSRQIKPVRSNTIEPRAHDGSTCASRRRPRFELLDKCDSGPAGTVQLVRHENHQLRRSGIILIR